MQIICSSCTIVKVALNRLFEVRKEGHTFVEEQHFISVGHALEDIALSLGNELMELSEDSSLKFQLTQVDLASFWILAATQYPSL